MGTRIQHRKKMLNNIIKETEDKERILTTGKEVTHTMKFSKADVPFQPITLVLETELETRIVWNALEDYFDKQRGKEESEHKKKTVRMCNWFYDNAGFKLDEE